MSLYIRGKTVPGGVIEGYVPLGDLFVDYDNSRRCHFSLPLPSEGQLSKQLSLLALI